MQVFDYCILFGDDLCNGLLYSFIRHFCVNSSNGFVSPNDNVQFLVLTNELVGDCVYTCVRRLLCFGVNLINKGLLGMLGLFSFDVACLVYFFLFARW